MTVTTNKKLKVAFTYDTKVDQIARGCTEEEASAYSSTVLIDSVQESLERLGHEVVHVGHVRNLATRLVAGQGKEWNVVFNLSEGVFGNAKEVQIPALLDAYQIPYTFSDAACLALAADKAKTKMILRHYDIPTSPFLVIPAYERIGTEEKWTATLVEQLKQVGLEISETQSLFIKPTLEGGSNGIDHRSKITSIPNLIEVSKSLHNRFQRQALMIEKFADGREFTAAIIGTLDQPRVLGIMEFRRITRPIGFETTVISNPEDDVDFATYKVKSVATANFFELINVTHEDSEEVREVGRIALAAFQVLGCRDLGRIDIRSIGRGVAARPQVLEMNAIPGLRPDNSHVPILAEQEGIKYDELISELLALALRRSGPRQE